MEGGEEGEGVARKGRSKREGLYAHIQLTHFVVLQKHTTF